MIWFLGYVLCYFVSVVFLLKAIKNNDGYVDEDSIIFAFLFSFLSPISTLFSLVILIASNSKLKSWLNEEL